MPSRGNGWQGSRQAGMTVSVSAGGPLCGRRGHPTCPAPQIVGWAYRRVLPDPWTGLVQHDPDSHGTGVDPITPAHTTVLAHLGNDTSLSIAELARRAGVTRQTMHRAVTQLVDEGLLTSSPGPGFPRSTLIGLTVACCRRREVALRFFTTWNRRSANNWDSPRWHSCALA